MVRRASGDRGGVPVEALFFSESNYLAVIRSHRAETAPLRRTAR